MKKVSKVEKFLFFNEQKREFSLDQDCRRADGWDLVSHGDERTLITYTEFIRGQFFDRKIRPTADEVGHTLGNLRRFLAFYDGYVRQRSFEIEDGRTGRVLSVNEIL